MAVIGTIRKRVGLLIIFVGVSMALFILGDLVTSRTGIMNRNGDVVGVVDGEKIHHAEFEKRVETLTENYKASTKNDNVDQNTLDMIREQAWGMFVNEYTLGKEYKDLGLSCSPEELYEMCTGPNANEQIKKAFTDPKTGQFDPNAVVRFLKDLPNRDENTQLQWKQFEDAIREDRIATKYRNLIKDGLYVTTDEAKRVYRENQGSASIRYVRLDYNTIPDSSVTVDDNDLKNYYNSHSNKFRQAETVRKVEYVTFDVAPSAEDRQAVTDWINGHLDEYKNTDNPIDYINRYSDTPFDSTFHAKGSLKPVLDTVMFTAAIGTTVGPYEDGNSLKISRLVAEQFLPDSVKARHILLKIEGTDTAKAMTLADSLKNAIRKGASFADLAMKYSQDPGSGAKGGDLGWFRQGTMVKPFNDACFEGKKGDMPVVVSQFGVHLIEILDKGVPAKSVQIGTLERKIEPSQKTFDLVYNKANQFAANNNTAEKFDSSIVKEGLNKRIADNLKETDRNISGLESPREMVRWAYEAKIGDISKTFTFGDKYVIGHLVEIKDKGILPMESVKEQVAEGAKKEKKAALLIEKIKNAGGASIDQIAQKLNVTAADADNLSFQNPYIPGVGADQILIGAVFGSKAGKISQPVQGENAVTVFTVKSFREPPVTNDYSATIKTILDQRKSRSEYEVFNALKEKAGIEDHRGTFY